MLSRRSFLPDIYFRKREPLKVLNDSKLIFNTMVPVITILRSLPSNNNLAANLMARAWNSSTELQTLTTIWCYDIARPFPNRKEN